MKIRWREFAWYTAIVMLVLYMIGCFVLKESYELQSPTAIAPVDTTLTSDGALDRN